jgi:hypothetical protein
MTIRKRETTLSEQWALARMREGSALVHTDGKPRKGHHWSIVPGGAVSDDVAYAIKQHPDVVSSNDGLFAGCDQTWRMKSFVETSPACWLCGGDTYQGEWCRECGANKPDHTTDENGDSR